MGINYHYRPIMGAADPVAFRLISDVSDFHAIMPVLGDPALKVART